MISRRIKCAPKNDDYRRLVRYIADASHDGEKTLMSWCAGCWSGDDEYELAITEVEATQALNTRTAREKTYHLMISFRPEDEAVLTPDIFKAIERAFAKILGFEEHQRHCGVHRNTDNLHLHIAYNQIHPERHIRQEPFYDFLKRDKICRELERKYDLSVDNGRAPETKKSINDAARAYEAHTGQESFFGYVQRHKEAIMPLLAQAKSWDDCHRALSKYSLTLKPHGNGLVIRDSAGNHSIKASDLDRSISKVKLEKRFGPFQSPSPDMPEPDKQTKKYNAIPLQKEPDRDGLYKQFQEARQKRKAALGKLDQQEKRLHDIKMQEWERKYQDIRRLPMDRKRRREVMQSYKDKKRKDFAALHQVMKQKKDEIKECFPCASWSQFLRSEAQRGNESALAVLRSKKDKALPERPQTQGQSQPHLSVVTKMAEIFRTAGVKGGKYRVDGKGTVIFTLPNGGSIRDTGKEVHFSRQDDQTKSIAEKLAQAKWGNDTHLDGGVLKRKSMVYAPIQRAPDKGLSR